MNYLNKLKISELLSQGCLYTLAVWQAFWSYCIYTGIRGCFQRYAL